MKTLKIDPSDKNIRNLGKHERIKVSSTMELYAVRQTGTSITYHLLYRIKGGGVTKRTNSLGHYPVLNVAEVTEKAIRWLKWAGEGVDPKRMQNASVADEGAVNEASRITFGEYFEMFLRQPASRVIGVRSDKTIRDYRTTFKNHAADLLNMPIRQVASTDIERVYHRCTKKPTQAKLLRMMKAIINSARKDLAADDQPYVLFNTDPLARVIRFDDRTEVREAYLQPTEFRLGLSYLLDVGYAANAFNLWSQIHALQIAALLGIRHSEVTRIRLKDIVQKGQVTRSDIVEEPYVQLYIAKKRKHYRHYVPLTPVLDSVITSQQLIRSCFHHHQQKQNPKVDYGHSEWLFPAPADRSKHLNDFALAVGYSRRGIEYQTNQYEYLKDPDATPTDGGFSAHWLRHTFVTMATDLWFRSEDIDKAQAKYTFSESNRYAQRSSRHMPLDNIANHVDALKPIFTQMAMLLIGYQTAGQMRRALESEEYQELSAKIETSNRYLHQALNPSNFHNLDMDDLNAMVDFDGGRFNSWSQDYEDECYSGLAAAANFFTPVDYEYPVNIPLFENEKPIKRPFSMNQNMPLHVVDGEVRKWSAQNDAA